MRRAGNNFEIVVKAPTMGLITRIPSEQPDNRAATVASNVRFEKGTAANAPGYGRLSTVPVIDSEVNLIHQATLVSPGLGATVNVAIIGTKQKIWSLARYPAGHVNQPPVVEAGTYDPVPKDDSNAFTLQLDGTVTDDGLPFGILRKKWTVTSAPGGQNVIFADDTNESTLATFSGEGQYTLRLSASDTPSGGYQSFDETTVIVSAAVYRVYSQVNNWNAAPGLGGFNPGTSSDKVIVWCLPGDGTRIKVREISAAQLTGNSITDFTADVLTNAAVIALAGKQRTFMFTLGLHTTLESSASGGWVVQQGQPYGLAGGIGNVPVVQDSGTLLYTIDFTEDSYGPQVPFVSGYDPAQSYAAFVPVQSATTLFYRSFAGDWVLQQNKPTPLMTFITRGAGVLATSSPAGISVNNFAIGDNTNTYSVSFTIGTAVTVTFQTGSGTTFQTLKYRGSTVTPTVVHAEDPGGGNGTYSYTFTMASGDTLDYSSTPIDF